MTERGALRLLRVAVLVLVPVAAARLPAGLDEAYYWTWSKDLAASYYDHPPGVAWTIAALRAGLGEGLLALRAGTVAAMLGVVLLARATAGRLAPPSRAGEASDLAELGLYGALMFTVGYLLATPDPFQGLILALAAYLAARGLAGEGWAAGAAAFALVAGALMKHTTALVAAGAFLGALLYPAGRRAVLRPAVAVGVGLGLLALAPWLWADLTGPDGATAFQAVRVAEGRPPRGLLGVPLTLGALLLTVGPAAGLALLAAAPAALRGRAGPDVSVGVFGALALVVGCMGAAWLGAGELNWLMPALAFGGPAVAAWVVAGPPRGLRVYRWATGVGALVSLVVLAHIVYPFAPIPARKDRTLRAAGFEDVAQVVDETMKAYGGRVALTRRYQLASMLRFHGREAWPVLELGSGRRSQYDRWPRPRLCAGEVAVMAWYGRDLPEELGLEPLGPVRTATRARAGRALDPIFVTPVRVTRSPYCPGGAP